MRNRNVVRELRKLVRAIPEAIPLRLKAIPPGSDTLVHRGVFRFYTGRNASTVRGQVIQSWMPSAQLTFQGSAPPTDLANPLQSYELSFRGIAKRANVTLSSVTIGTNPSTARGRITGKLVKGKRLPTATIEWHLVNFHKYSSLRVRHGRPSKAKIGDGRLILKSRDWQIIVDEDRDIEATIDQLKSGGGFGVTHVAHLSAVGGARIRIRDAEELGEAGHIFFAFLRGAWCGPVGVAGVDKRGVVWSEWGPWKLSSFRQIASWCPWRVGPELSVAFSNFMDLWNEPRWRDPLRSAVHWYVEANTGSTAVETGVILAQVALELLSWVILVEVHAKWKRKTFESLPASRKISELLGHLGIPTTIPKEHKALYQFAGSLGLKDGPTAIAYLRNGLVHPVKHKREALAQVEVTARFEAQHLALQYVELVLLAALGYRGKYQRRVWGTSRTTATVAVPWL